MSYEKLGFEKGQVLKAEHLNHMEDGIANAGGVGFEYWKGNVTWNNTDKYFTFEGIDFRDYEEVEIGVRLNDNSYPPFAAKYSFITTDNTSIIYLFSNEFGHACPQPNAKLDLVCGAPRLCFEEKAISGAAGVYNPEIIFVRLYHKV